MRALTFEELQIVGGGGEEVVIEAPRYPDLWQWAEQRFMQGPVLQLFGAENAKRLIPGIGNLIAIGGVALWRWENVIDDLGTQIDNREDKARYDESKLVLKVIDGHRHMEVLGAQERNFWLDCDGDGRLDTQYKYDSSGKLLMDFTGDGQWLYVPERSDWRRGFGG